MSTVAEDLKTKIEEEIQVVEWEALRPHAKRDAVILVSQELSLTDAGIKIVADDVQSVEAWLSDGKLSKLSQEDISSWDQTPEKAFSFVILQPFVLIQEQRH